MAYNGKVGYKRLELIHNVQDSVYNDEVNAESIWLLTGQYLER